MSDVDNELCCLGLLEPNSFDHLHVCVYVLKSVRNIVPQHQSLSTISGFGKTTCCLCNIRFSSDVFFSDLSTASFWNVVNHEKWFLHRSEVHIHKRNTKREHIDNIESTVRHT